MSITIRTIRSSRFAPRQFLAGALAALLAGCGTMKVPAFKVRETTSYQYLARTNGLVVAVQPITDKSQIKETFKVDLLAKGIVPILVVVDNQSATSTLVAREKVFVLNPHPGTNNTPLDRRVASGSAGEQTAMAGSALLGVAVIAAPAAVVIAAPLLIAGMKSMSNADVIRHNLSDKALASHTVEPGQRAYGYLYFELPKGAKFGAGHQVVVELNDPATSDPLTFVFDVQ